MKGTDGSQLIPQLIPRTYSITVGQAEWLRQQSFAQRRSQVEIVREALDSYRAECEKEQMEKNRMDKRGRGWGRDLGKAGR